MVSHAERDALGARRLHADANVYALTGVLDGIVEKVGDRGP